jgi:tRNA(Arg) A34 adenosine deaminase TadA
MGLDYIKKSIELSQLAVRSKTGGPFGAIIVLNDKIIGEGKNEVILRNDPTAHAEVMAIRNACENIKKYDLSGSILYTSCEPCPMCLGAIYWARIESIFYANTREDAQSIGFDDSRIYKEFAKEMSDREIPICQIKSPQAYSVFEEWKKDPKNILY